MHLASRLGESDLSEVAMEELITLHAEDFAEANETQNKKNSGAIRMGFGE